MSVSAAQERPRPKGRGRHSPERVVRMPARANSGEAQIDRGKASRIADSALLHVEGAISDLGQVGRGSNQRTDQNRRGDRGVRSKARRDDGLRRHRGIVDFAEEYATKSRVEPRKRMERRETPHAPSAQRFILQPKSLRRNGNRTKRGCELFTVLMAVVGRSHLRSSLVRPQGHANQDGLPNLESTSR